MQPQSSLYKNVDIQYYTSDSAYHKLVDRFCRMANRLFNLTPLLLLARENEIVGWHTCSEITRAQLEEVIRLAKHTLNLKHPHILPVVMEKDGLFRSYAGIPFLYKYNEIEGGIFCLVGTHPHIFENNELETLQDLTDSFVEGLKSITHPESVFEEIQEESQLMAYKAVFNPEYRIIAISNIVHKITGHYQQEFTSNMHFWQNHIHPEDLDRVKLALENILVTGSAHIEYRFMFKAGMYHWLYDSMRLETSDGSVPIISGYMLDISALKKFQPDREIYTGIIQPVAENKTFWSFAKDLNGRYISVNKRLEDILGLSASKILGKTDYELFPHQPPEILQKWAETDQRIITTQNPLEFRDQLQEANGEAVYLSVKFPLFDAENKLYAIGCISNNISDIKRNEDEALIQLGELTVLNRIINAAASSLDINEVMTEICREMVDAMRVEHCVFLLLDEAKQIIKVEAEFFKGNRESLNNREFSLDESIATRRIVNTGQHLIVENIHKLPPEVMVKHPAIAPDIISIMLMPILSRGEVKGLFILSSVKARHFSRDEIALVQSVANTTSNVVENSQLYKAIQKELNERKISENALQQNHNLLEALTQAQARYISEENHREVFEDLLANLLTLTNSEYGFIGEIIWDEIADPFVRTYSITNIAWNEAMRRLYAEQEASGMEFHNMKTLFGKVVTDGKPIISNNPYTDPRRGGLPKGHPPLNNFMGLPVFSSDKLVGIVCIANRATGYTDELAHFLQPFLTTCAILIEGYHNTKRRKVAEEALRESEERYRFLTENATDVIFRATPDGVIKYISPASKTLLGYTPKEIVDHSVLDFIDTSYKEILREILINTYNNPDMITFIAPNTHKDGRTIWIETTARTLFEPETGQPTQFIGVSRDVTQRKRVEDALETERELLSVTLRSIADGVITTDIEGNILLFNRVAELFTGWSQHEAKNVDLEQVLVLLNPTNRKRVDNPVHRILREMKLVEQNTPLLLIGLNGVERFITYNGTPILDPEGKLLGTVLTLLDVTEEEKIAEERLKSSNLESLGILAGGIAHDYNNLLTAIIGNITLAQFMLDSNEELQETLKEAEIASLRAKDLTQQLLTFAKGGSPVKRTAKLTEIVKDTARFVLRGSKVQAEYFFPDNLWMAEVDQRQLSQVFQNLVLNAVQATPEGGKVALFARNLEVTEEQYPLLKPGKFIQIKIQDWGTGIKAENLTRIFDPYFTTKETGSGLGLSICYSIIKKHDGLITVESTVGVGTTFTIYLPATLDSVTEED